MPAVAGLSYFYTYFAKLRIGIGDEHFDVERQQWIANHAGRFRPIRGRTTVTSSSVPSGSAGGSRLASTGVGFFGRTRYCQFDRADVLGIVRPLSFAE